MQVSEEVADAELSSIGGLTIRKAPVVLDVNLNLIGGVEIDACRKPDDDV
jgi:hypothetical protein